MDLTLLPRQKAPALSRIRVILRIATIPHPASKTATARVQLPLGSIIAKNFCTIKNESTRIAIMSGLGLEVLLEGLISEIAYSGEKGMSAVTSLFDDS